MTNVYKGTSRAMQVAVLYNRDPKTAVQKVAPWLTLDNDPYPVVEEKYLIESTKNYPIAINGKTRHELNIALDATQQQVEEIVLADEIVRKWLDGNSPKKIVYVKNKMINVVV